MPNDSEAAPGSEKPDKSGVRGIFGHLNSLVIRLLGFGMLHLPKGVAVIYLGHTGEVIGRRRRADRPLQRAAVPRIGADAVLITLPDAVNQLQGLYSDAQADNLKFAWRPDKSHILISSLPVNKIVIEEDPQKETPSIQFLFDLRIVMNRWDMSVNDHIDKDCIVTATVRISPADLEKEYYLPFKH